MTRKACKKKMSQPQDFFIKQNMFYFSKKKNIFCQLHRSILCYILHHSKNFLASASIAFEKQIATIVRAASLDFHLPNI